MQGFAVRINHADLLTEALPEAILRLLGDQRYAQAAAMVSVKLRARKRTPVQEAAGASAHPFVHTHAVAQQQPSQCALLAAADWVEHALATHGEAYLMTPEDELTVVQRHNIDVIATYLGGACIALFAVWQVLWRVGATVLASAAPRQKSKVV